MNLKLVRIKKSIQRTYSFESKEDTCEFIKSINVEYFRISNISENGLEITIEEIFYDDKNKEGVLDAE